MERRFSHTCRKMRCRLLPVVLAAMVMLTPEIHGSELSYDSHVFFGRDNFRCYWLPQSDGEVWGPAIVWRYERGFDDGNRDNGPLPPEYKPVELAVIARGYLTPITTDKTELLAECGPPDDGYWRRPRHFYPATVQDDREKKEHEARIRDFFDGLAEVLRSADVVKSRICLIHKQLPSDCKEFLTSSYWIITWNENVADTLPDGTTVELPPSVAIGTVLDSDDCQARCSFLTDSWDRVAANSEALRQVLNDQGDFPEILALGDRGITLSKGHFFDLILLGEWEGVPVKRRSQHELEELTRQDDWIAVSGRNLPPREEQIASMLSLSRDDGWNSFLKADPILWFLMP